MDVKGDSAYRRLGDGPGGRGNDIDGEETRAVLWSQATTPLPERDGVQVVATGELGERTT